MQVTPIVDPGLIWSLAIAAGVLYAIRSARLSGLDSRQMYWLAVVVAIGGLWGGRIGALLVHGAGTGASWMFWAGPASFHGGLIGGAVAGTLLLRSKRLPIAAFADAGVPAVALGYCIGRLACFINGDDFGTPTAVPWAVQYLPGTEAQEAHALRGWVASGEPSLPVHPVQVYASLHGLALFALLLKPRREGMRLLLFVLGYAAGRFLMEYLRGDFHATVGPLSMSQLASMAFIASGLFVSYIRRARRQEVCA